MRAAEHLHGGQHLRQFVFTLFAAAEGGYQLAVLDRQIGQRRLWDEFVSRFVGQAAVLKREHVLMTNELKLPDRLFDVVAQRLSNELAASGHQLHAHVQRHAQRWMSWTQ